MISVSIRVSDTPYSFYVRAVDVNGIQGRRSKVVRVQTTGPARTTGNATAFVLESDGASFADLQQHYMKVGTIFPTYFNCTPSQLSSKFVYTTWK